MADCRAVFFALPSLTSGPFAARPVPVAAPLLPPPAAKLQRLSTVDLAMKGIETVAPPCGLDALTELDLAFNDIHDIAVLGTLTNLRELNRYGVRVSILAPLSRLERLKVLPASSGNIRNLDALAQRKQRIRAGVRKTDGSDTTMAESTCTSSIVDGSTLRRFAMPHRSKSCISATIVSLDPLATLKNLAVLRIEQNPVESLAPLAGLEKLILLMASETRIGADQEHCPTDAVAVVSNYCRKLRGLQGASTFG